MKTYENKVRKTRRPNGEGCVYYSKDGFWVAKKWVNENGVKKRVSIYGRTRTELMRKFILRFGNDGMLNGKDKLSLLFNEHFLDWLIKVKKLEVSSVSLNCNVILFKNHINKYFDGRTIGQSIIYEIILDFFNKLIDKGVSKNIFLKSKFLINQYINYLMLMKYPILYPIILTKIKYPRRDLENTYKAIPIEIYDEYLEKLNENKTLKCVCYLGLFAGLRIGEILALKWTDLDFTNRTIRIDSSLSRNIVFNSAGEVQSSKRILGRTKTSCSQRIVPMPNILYDVLYKLKLEQDIINKIEHNVSDFVFHYNDELRSYSGLRIILSRFNKRNGFIKYNIHFHSFRHTYATRLLEKGTNPKIVQFLLGHRSVKTTLEIYNNINTYNKSLLEILDNVFKI